jgi:hypothetical protein
MSSEFLSGKGKSEFTIKIKEVMREMKEALDHHGNKSHDGEIRDHSGSHSRSHLGSGNSSLDIVTKARQNLNEFRSFVEHSGEKNPDDFLRVAQSVISVFSELTNSLSEARIAAADFDGRIEEYAEIKQQKESNNGQKPRWSVKSFKLIILVSSVKLPKQKAVNRKLRN